MNAQYQILCPNATNGQFSKFSKNHRYILEINLGVKLILDSFEMSTLCYHQ